MRTMSAGLILLSCLLLASPSNASAGDSPADASSTKAQPRVVRIGAVAYSPSAVTIFESLRRYLDGQGLPVDYVLYSNYDSLVDALHQGHVDIAWNTPLAHARYHRKAGDASQTLVMRDVDCNFRSMLIVRTDAGIHSLDDLKGKTMILGSRQAAEATILPVHFLKREGLDLASVKVKSLDGLVDLRGNPCSSEVHVLKALQDGQGQAGIVGERFWNHLASEQPDQVSGLKTLWISPPFSHCVFTASKDFDRGLADRFSKLMLAMDPNDPATADIMRLEGTRKWVAGSPDGFQELVNTLREEPDLGRSAGSAAQAGSGP